MAQHRTAPILAGLTVVAVAAAGLLLHHPPRPAASAAVPAASAAPSATSAAPSATSAALSRDRVYDEHGGLIPERGPAHATAGTPYPFDLFVHCGIRYAEFSGTQWQADPVQPDFRTRPGDRLDYVQGTMVLVTEGEARFASLDGALRVTFRPPSGRLELCG